MRKWNIKAPKLRRGRFVASCFLRVVELLSSWRLESAFSSLFLTLCVICVFGLFSPPRPLAARFAGQFCVCFSIFQFYVGSRRGENFGGRFLFSAGVGETGRSWTIANSLDYFSNLALIPRCQRSFTNIYPLFLAVAGFDLGFGIWPNAIILDRCR